MSIDAMRWAKKVKTGKSSSKAILTWLADMCGADLCAYPSVAALAEATELDKKTVQAGLRHLIEIGLITDTGERRGRTKQINHDPNAVAMHTTNHPNTLHYCESVYDVRPKVATAGRPVALAWFSPDCRHFSKAKGAKPVDKAIRGLAWVVLRWGLDVKPRVMKLENVEEFKTWGPLLAGEMRPDPARAGETFEAFIGMLTTGIRADHPALAECCEFLGISLDSEDAARLIKGLGYIVEYRELRACDYGAPTIRKRFFMVMRCDGKPIVWPEPTHGDPKSPAVQAGKLAPWRTAAECIDWSIPCPSIFDRKKPLAENTLKRIARGIQRFVIDSASPFIVKCNHTSSRSSYDCFRGQSLEEPLQTITKKHGYAVAVPHLTKFRTGATGQPVTEPVPTVTPEKARERVKWCLQIFRAKVYLSARKLLDD